VTRGAPRSPGRVAWLALAGVAALAVAVAPRERDGAALADADPVDLLYAPHGDVDDGFFTPWTDDPKSLWGVVRWKLFSTNAYDKRRDPVVPRVPNDGVFLAGVEPGATVTWVGHSTFAIHDGDDVILTDPHWGPRALIPARQSEPGIPLEAVPDDAFAILSHNHYDHLDTDTVEWLPESVAWFVPLGLADWFRERRRPNVVELDWWQSAEHGRWTITCLPSQHWSRRVEMGTNRSLWCTWLVASEERRYFFAGDTGYFHGFAEFGRRFGPIDVAMLPIGAYEPRWFMQWQHLDPAEAVQAYRDLGARAMLGMHWGTFDLTDEPIDLPPYELRRLVSRQGLDPERVRALAVGETWRVPPRESGQAEETE
jgi:N-acyl-phosphatidylethanolamine-hydrolysing phospholipase D